VLTLIKPFYRNCAMLAEQVRNWNAFPSDVRVILVDDGSPEPAYPIVKENATAELMGRLELYRIDVDIPWNRGGARNLGTQQANTDWIVHADIDHMLRPECAARLLEFKADPASWYRFPRLRKGAADETRRKDALPPGQAYGRIHPHIDSYLCTRAMYWRAGGYNEDFSGCLGGGSPFLQMLEREAKPVLLPEDIFLEVYTRHTVKDASDFSLSRDTDEFRRRKAKLGSDLRGKNPIRFPWRRVA
jgi:glycosyl transferase family 2